MATHTIRVHCALPEALFSFRYNSSVASDKKTQWAGKYLLEHLDQSIHHLALFEAHVVDVVRLHTFVVFQYNKFKNT
jgi:hypothetical protein